VVPKSNGDQIGQRDYDMYNRCQLPVRRWSERGECNRKIGE